MDRRPLSDAPEEPAFLLADAACDEVASYLAPLVAAMFSRAGSGESASLAEGFTRELVPDVPTGSKAKRKPAPGATAEELMEAALDAGIDLGIATLPEDVRDELDRAGAMRRARKAVRKGLFAKSLEALEEALRGQELLVEKGKLPSAAVLRDPDRLAEAFGLNSRQAQTIVNEVARMVKRGDRADSKKVKDHVRRRMKQAVAARAETVAQDLGREAIGAAQQAVFEQAVAQGLLRPKAVRQWVTRGDNKVCARCKAFSGKKAPLGKPFVSRTGEKAMRPAIHPNDRCTVRLVAAAQRRVRAAA